MDVDEQLVVKAGANLFRGIEAVGGFLYIMNRRLIFEPHPFNIQKMIEIVDIGDVTDIFRRNTVQIVPNGMGVRTRQGIEYHFVVWHRDRLIATIKELMAHQSRPSTPAQ